MLLQIKIFKFLEMKATISLDLVKFHEMFILNPNINQKCCLNWQFYMKCVAKKLPFHF